MIRISLSFTVLEVPESERFFLGEGSFRYLLTVSTWRPNYRAMVSEGLPLAHSLPIVAFSASVRDLPRPIMIPKKKLLAPVTRITQKLQLYANNAPRANVT